MYKGSLLRKVLYFGVVLVVITLLITGCTSSEVIREATDAYLSRGKAPNILADELYGILYDGNPDNDPFILSVRSHEYYERGHIPGAVNIPWREVAKQENLAKLPKDRQIVVYCIQGILRLR